jgi:hypothetical protein
MLLFDRYDTPEQTDPSNPVGLRMLPYVKSGYHVPCSLSTKTQKNRENHEKFVNPALDQAGCGPKCMKKYTFYAIRFLDISILVQYHAIRAIPKN